MAAFFAPTTGCDDSTTSTSDAVYTELYVDPASFRGAVSCSELSGGMQAFVVTLIDVTTTGADIDPSLRVALPSSPPTACTARTGFSSVVPGHFYVGEIDAYDRAICPASGATAGCISPLGGPISGSRVMVDDAGTVVAPRWTTTCGDPTIVGSTKPTELDAPTESLYLTAVPLRACVAMSLDGSSAGPVSSGARIDSSALLGELSCGLSAGQVDRLDVSVSVLEGGVESPLATLDPQLFCGASVNIGDLDPGKTYLFDVAGFEADATTARWGARCSATVAGGLIVPATCATLREDGSLRLLARDLIAAQGATCTTGQDQQAIARLEASLVGVDRTTSGACNADLRFGELAAGSYTLAAVGYTADGSAAFSTICRGDVMPGQETIVSCDGAPSSAAPSP